MQRNCQSALMRLFGHSAFRFFKIFLANGSLISGCHGTASTAPFFGLIQSECETPLAFEIASRDSQPSLQVPSFHPIITVSWIASSGSPLRMSAFRSSKINSMA